MLLLHTTCRSAGGETWLFRIAIFACLFVLAPLHMDAASGQTASHSSMRAVALVIGNSAYRYAGMLPNPRNDANAVAGAMRELGFDVTAALDRQGAELRRDVELFLAKVRTAEVIFFYYAGHAVQIGGHNYIAPIDTRVDMEFQADLIALDALLAEVERDADPSAAKIIVLDACRNNPWDGMIAPNQGGKTRGLARIDDTGRPEATTANVQGTRGYYRILAFATAAGEVAEDGSGSHSPYTRSLLRFVRQQGLEVGEMFRLIANDVLRETGGRQRPEYLVQTSRALFFRVPYVTECDQVAIEGQNFLGLIGVPFDDVDPVRAIPACEEAVKDAPDSARIHNNLARAYEKAERLSEALRHYAISAEAGYPPALNALGIMYLSGCGLKAPEIERGIKLIVQARELGNLSARASLTAHDMLNATEPRGIKRLQEALRRTGHYNGPVDGKLSQALRTALQGYQNARGLAQKGFTLETVDALALYDAVPRRFRCH